MYIVLSLVSGVLLGLFYIVKKEVLKNNDVITVLAAYSVIGFLLLIVDYQVAFQIDKSKMIFIIIKSVLIYFGWILSGKAIKELPLSISSPLGILNSIFTVFLGIFLLEERMKPLQIAGVIVIFISYYFIGKVGELEVKNIFRNKYVFYMTIAMFIGAISAIIDKVVLKDIKVEQLQFWFYFFLAVLYTLTYIGMNFIKKRSGNEKVKFKFSYWMIVLGLLIVLADKIYFWAVKIPEANISIVIPLRYISIIISTIVGGLIFKEKNIVKKFKYMIGIVIGIILIFV